MRPGLHSQAWAEVEADEALRPLVREQEGESSRNPTARKKGLEKGGLSDEQKCPSCHQEVKSNRRLKGPGHISVS